jgi:hypothetical protein
MDRTRALVGTLAIRTVALAYGLFIVVGGSATYNQAHTSCVFGHGAWVCAQRLTAGESTGGY